jgi:hypothetical protein
MQDKTNAEFTEDTEFAEKRKSRPTSKPGMRGTQPRSLRSGPQTTRAYGRDDNVYYTVPRWGRAVLDFYESVRNEPTPRGGAGHYKRQKRIPLPLCGIGMTMFEAGLVPDG